MCARKELGRHDFQSSATSQVHYPADRESQLRRTTIEPSGKTATRGPETSSNTSQLAALKESTLASSVSGIQSQPAGRATALGKSSKATLPVKPGATHRLFRRLHRLHRHVDAVAATFDIGSGDLSDAEDTEESRSGSDNDSDSASTSDKSIEPRKTVNDSTNVPSAASANRQGCATHSTANEMVDDKDKEGVTSLKHSMKSLEAPHTAINVEKHSSNSAKPPPVKVTEKEFPMGPVSGAGESRRSAQYLGRRTSRSAQIIIWAIMVLMPLLFVVLAVMSAILTGRPANSRMGAAIIEANTAAVSIWPIVFAAVLAQSLRIFASYKVERGLRLMTLEQLISSHSVASAIKQPFFLRRINLLSIVILCVWSLSPLAGQAILRMSSGPGKCKWSDYYNISRHHPSQLCLRI